MQRMAGARSVRGFVKFSATHSTARGSGSAFVGSNQAKHRTRRRISGPQRLATSAVTTAPDFQFAYGRKACQRTKWLKRLIRARIRLLTAVLWLENST